MSNSKLSELNLPELKKKLNDTKMLTYALIPVSLGLAYYSFKDSFNGGEIDTTLSIIFICCLGALASCFPELNKIKKELKSR